MHVGCVGSVRFGRFQGLHAKASMNQQFAMEPTEWNPYKLIRGLIYVVCQRAPDTILCAALLRPKSASETSGRWTDYGFIYEGGSLVGSGIYVEEGNPRAKRGGGERKGDIFALVVSES